MTGLYTPSRTPSQQRAAAERRARERKIAAQAHADTPIVCAKPAPAAPITTEQLDKLQFGRPLHKRPPPADPLPGVTIDRILTAVAQHFGIGRGKILSSSMQRHLTRPRHIAMYLARQLLGYSPGRIAIAFNRDRTSVLYGIRKIGASAHLGETARDLAAIAAMLAADREAKP